jgi:hypothetical protein
MNRGRFGNLRVRVHTPGTNMQMQMQIRALVMRINIVLRAHMYSRGNIQIYVYACVTTAISARV